MERFSSYDFVNIIVLNIKEPKNIVNNQSKKNQINSSDHKPLLYEKESIYLLPLQKNKRKPFYLILNDNLHFLVEDRRECSHH